MLERELYVGGDMGIDFGNRIVLKRMLAFGLALSLQAHAAQGGKGGSGGGKADTSPPIVSITSAPNEYINSRSASVSFTASDPGRRKNSGVARIECSLDGSVFSVCLSPQNLTNLTEDRHSFSIRAIDSAGNISSPAIISFVVDVTKPSIAFNSVPPSSSTSTTAVFSFAVADANPLANVTCSLDSASFQSCSSPKAVSNLSVGSHSFSVRAIDVAGNSQQVTNTFTVEQSNIDIVPPVLSLTSTPNSYINSTSTSLTFSVSDSGGSGVDRSECSLDGAAYTVCLSPLNLSSLAQAKHTVNLRAYDKAGNVSNVMSFSFTVDTTKPTLAITSQPEANTESTSASFSFNISDSSPLAARECSLDGAGYSACASPKVYTVGVGSHSFSLRATDMAGNTSTINYLWSVINSTPTDWVISIPLEFAAGSGMSIDLKPTLPAGTISGGIFGVDPSGTQLPSGMALSEDGLLNVGTAQATDVSGVVFYYAEPSASSP